MGLLCFIVVYCHVYCPLRGAHRVMMGYHSCNGDKLLIVMSSTPAISRYGYEEISHFYYILMGNQLSLVVDVVAVVLRYLLGVIHNTIISFKSSWRYLVHVMSLMYGSVWALVSHCTG